KLQSELLLNRGEETRRVRIDRWRCRTRRKLAWWNLRLELELELPVAGEPRPIDNGTSDAGADASREQLQRVVAKPDTTGTLLDPADHWGRPARCGRWSASPRGNFLR